jgi:hypothetical protein
MPLRLSISGLVAISLRTMRSFRFIHAASIPEEPSRDDAPRSPCRSNCLHPRGASAALLPMPG